ncbi:protein of unknown function, partial [Cellulomonas marina]
MGVGSALAAVQVAVDAVAAVLAAAGPGGRAVEGQGAVEAVAAALRLAGRLEAVAAALLPVVEADGLWAVAGARSLAGWVGEVGRVPHARAAALVRTGRVWQEVVPATGRAAVAGDIGVEAARVIASAATTPARVAALQEAGSVAGEGFLLAQARVQPVGSFRRLVSRWSAAADPEADERGFREAQERQFV